MTFRSARREVAGAVRRLRRLRCHGRPRAHCKRYNLEVLATVYRGTGRRPVLRPAGNPARTFEFAGAPQANGPASPPGAARTCRKGEFPSAGSGSFLPCSGENDSRCIRIGFLFINTWAGSIGKVLNIASCYNAHGSFDVRSLIKKAGKRLAAVAFRGDHAISGLVPAR